MSTKLCVDCGKTLDKNEAMRKEIMQLRARIAELETAQAWHPASEPPEELDENGDSVDYLCRNKTGKMLVGYYSKHLGWLFYGLIFVPDEYQPLPERSET